MAKVKCGTCACKVEPLRLDVCPIVKPACKFDLNCNQTDLFAIWTKEQSEASGTEVTYWSQDLEKSQLDPLYNEPEERVWHGPYKLTGNLDWPEQAFEVREEGARIIWTGKLFLSRLSVENANFIMAPKEGDVIRVWQIPHFDQFAQGVDSNIPNAGYFFDVTQAQETGYPFDGPDFTGFTLDIARRTEFTPERRVLNQT